MILQTFIRALALLLLIAVTASQAKQTGEILDAYKAATGGRAWDHKITLSTEFTITSAILWFRIASWKASPDCRSAESTLFQSVRKQLCVGFTTQRDHLLYPHTGSLQSAWHGRGHPGVGSFASGRAFLISSVVGGVNSMM